MLDTSLYPYTRLRADGRRWNELRHLSARISPLSQTSADGSAYVEMGYTKVLCVVTGPSEPVTTSSSSGDKGEATVVVEIIQPGFALEGRRRRIGTSGVTTSSSSSGTGGGGGLTDLQSSISRALSSALFLQAYPHSTIKVSLQVLSLDGSLLAAGVNASCLALVDAGVGMRGLVCACTCGLAPAANAVSGASTSAVNTVKSASTHVAEGKQSGAGAATTTKGASDMSEVITSNALQQDPLLDLNSSEESSLPYLTIATLSSQSSSEDRVVLLSLDRRVPSGIEGVEGMMASAVDGCSSVRAILDSVIREHGARVISTGGGGNG